MIGTILETIVETKRGEVAEAKRVRPVAELRDAVARVDPPRDFYAAIVGGDSGIRLIAEIKKSSPSAGLIREDFDPVAIARIYESAGASALSVLTDRTYFSGDLSFVEVVRRAVGLPVLRKDFIVDEYQVVESRAAGADAILLIVGVLSVGQIEAWSATAAGFGMTTLIEVHNAEQCRTILGLIGEDRRCLLGINNRDLRIQKTDIGNTARVAEGLPSGTPFVAESGIKTREDVLRLQQDGARALLIGETFMRAPDIAAEVHRLLGGNGSEPRP